MKLPLFPLHTVLFPGMPLPLHIFEPRYRDMINACLQEKAAFGVALIRSGAEVGGPAEPHFIGTAARISRVERLPDQRLNIEAVGQERFRILALHHDQSFLTGTVAPFPLLGTRDPASQQAAEALRPWLSRYLALLGEAARTEIKEDVLPTDPASVAYLAAVIAQIPLAEKQDLLSISGAAELLARERAIYRREVSLLGAMLHQPALDSNAPFSPN